MINRFLLFMKMFLTGLFKFAVAVAVYLTAITGVLIVVEVITMFKILNILFLIFLTGVAGVILFFIADDFWSRYKRERDSRGLQLNIGLQDILMGILFFLLKIGYTVQVLYRMVIYEY